MFAEAELTFRGVEFSGSARAEGWRIGKGRAREFGVSDTRFEDRDGINISGRINAFRPGGTVDLRAAAYRGVRLPTLNELYRPFTIFPVTTLANAALKPERVIGAEAEVVGQAAPRRARLGHPLRQPPHECNRQRHRRAEPAPARECRCGRARAELKAAIGWTQGPWSLDGAASFLRARIDDDGNLDRLRPAQVPARSLSATAAYRSERMSFAATLRHLSAAYDDDLNLDRLPPATTIDLVFRRRLADRLNLHLRAENLFDARTITRNQAGSIDLGAPRTIWLGFSL